MDKQQWQQKLPEGLNLGRELSGAVLFGTTFEAEDHRFPGKDHLRRFVYCLETNDSDGWMTNWTQQLFERVNLLSSISSPHIARLLESRLLKNQREVYLVDDRPEFRLSIPRGGLDPTVAAHLFRQVVDGLVDLHDQTHHGDLRLCNLYISESKPSEDSRCRIANAAVGPLMYWSRGRLPDDEARNYYPPQWEENARKPSTEGDLYALGVLGCVLFLGPGRRTAEEARKELKEKKVPRNIQKVLNSLLHCSKKERPSSARDVRKMLNRPPLWKHLVIALVMIVMIGWVIDSRNGWRKESKIRDATEVKLKDAEGKLEVAKKKLKFVQEERDYWKDRFGVQDDKIKKIENVLKSGESDREQIRKIRIIVGEADPDWEKIALEALAGTSGTQRLPAVFFKRLLDAIGKRKPPDTDKQKQWKIFAKQLRSLSDSGRALAWQMADTSDGVVKKYRSLVRQAVLRPWSPKLEEAQDQLSALDAAADIWLEYATKQNLSWTDFQSKTNDAAVGKSNESRVQAILRRWRAPFNSHEGKWTLQLISGKAEDDRWGVERYFTLYVDGEDADYTYHDWDEATSHVYSEDHKKLKFSWEPGQSVGMLLEGKKDWTFTRPNIIDLRSDTENFGGPVAVWWVNKNTKFTIRDNGVEFKVKVKDCPGPPPDVYKSGLGNLARTAAEKLLK